ncbi:MAG: hypothetical protein ACLGHQ_14185 [Acidimicrobiia bacterium]
MIEAVAAGVAGAALGGATGLLVGVPVPAAIVGGLNGVVSGSRRVYDWRTPTGVSAFVLDSSWALLTTTGGLVAHAIGSARGAPGFVATLSERRNRHVYARGFQPRRGFAITMGNVVNGAGDTGNPRRVRLVTDHEDVHVWQARLFGPAYPALYLGWMVGGGVVGAVAWLVRHRDRRFTAVVDTYAYYLNPFEWWAYSRDEHWPPSGKLADVGWKRPAVRSFSALGRSGR